MFLVALSAFGQATSPESTQSCAILVPTKIDTELPSDKIAFTEARIRELESASFPELQNIDLSVRIFHSQSDYFQSPLQYFPFFAVEEDEILRRDQPRDLRPGRTL